jgi:Glyceraldehyde-3-phosphate dehydrogenase/erythrose-4-phosphate dehydrogenase
MTIKVGINGLGRIGRMVLRSIFENKNKKILVKHINNRTGTDVVSSLLKYDSIHGKFDANINYNSNSITINNNKISFTQKTKIEDINWKKLNVDYVLECTGKFNSKEILLKHIKNGAKKVIVSAPCKNSDKTIVYGVNEKTIRKNDKIISAASCTTNCLAPSCQMF